MKNQWILINLTFHDHKFHERSKSQNEQGCGPTIDHRSNRSMAAVPLTFFFHRFHLRLCIYRAGRTKSMTELQFSYFTIKPQWRS